MQPPRKPKPRPRPLKPRQPSCSARPTKPRPRQKPPAPRPSKPPAPCKRPRLSRPFFFCPAAASTALRMLSTQRHHGAGNARNGLAIITLDFTAVVADRASTVLGPRPRAQPGTPDRAQEGRLQVDAGETLAWLHQSGMRRAYGSIGQFAQHSAMDRALLVAMALRIGVELHDGHGFADGHYAKPQHLRDRGRSEEHTSELQSPCNLVCRLLLEKKKQYTMSIYDVVERTVAV